MLYMVTWIPSIYPSHVSIYTSTMDPSWDMWVFYYCFANTIDTSILLLLLLYYYYPIRYYYYYYYYYYYMDPIFFL